MFQTATATALQIQDAKGRDSVLTYLRCPRPGCPGLIVRLNSLVPAHLGTLAIGQLCRALRDGSEWEQLVPSEERPGLAMGIIRRPYGDAHFSLAYFEREPDVGYLLINGAEPSSGAFASSVALDGKFRRELADRLTAELVEGQPVGARA